VLALELAAADLQPSPSRPVGGRRTALLEELALWFSGNDGGGISLQKASASSAASAAAAAAVAVLREICVCEAEATEGTNGRAMAACGGSPASKNDAIGKCTMAPQQLRR